MTKQTNGGWIESVPAVDIELMDDGNVRITDKSAHSDDYSVDLHPVQIRMLAEKLGLIRQASTSEAAMEANLRHEIATLTKDIDRMQRALMCISERTEHLFKDLCITHDHGHEDLSLEVAKCAALTDFLDLAISDFKDEWTNTDRPVYGKKAKEQEKAPAPAVAPPPPPPPAPRASKPSGPQQLQLGGGNG